MADKFTSCVLPQDATPDEINKGMLDLLKKANQVHTDLTESATAQTEALATVDKTLTDKIDGLDFTALKDVNGYQKLPSGLIIQWGKFTSADTVTTTVTFPIEFPTACVSVGGLQMGVGGADGYKNGFVLTVAPTKTSCSIKNFSNSTADYYWQAIGY